MVLADEVLTPDSSRFWPADSWEPGRAQPSYDKQNVRDWLSGESGWDRKSARPRRRCPPRSSSDPLPVHQGLRATDRRDVLTTRRFRATVELPALGGAWPSPTSSTRATGPSGSRSLLLGRPCPTATRSPTSARPGARLTVVGVRPQPGDHSSSTPFRSWAERGSWRGVEATLRAALRPARRDGLPRRRRGRGLRSRGCTPSPRGARGLAGRSSRSAPTSARPPGSWRGVHGSMRRRVTRRSRIRHAE